jgi:surfactin synthase thioesterase subunit
LVPPDVELWSVALPGRLQRFAEPAVHDATVVLAELRADATSLPSLPTAYFGHSFGGLLAYALASSVASGASPKLLVLSGCTPPRASGGSRTTTHRDTVQDVIKLGGIPEPVLTSAEFAELFLPSIRADLNLARQLRTFDLQPLPLRIVAVSGDKDRLAPADLAGSWEQYALGGFRHEVIPGDHFFVQSSVTDVLALVQEELGLMLPVATE